MAITFSSTTAIGGSSDEKEYFNGRVWLPNPNYKPQATPTGQATAQAEAQKILAQSQLEVDSNKMALANQYREKEGATQRDIDKAQTERTKISDSGATERNRQSLETQRGMVGLNQQANNQTKNEDADRARGALAAFSRGF
jgi:hypothetical protein